MDHPTKAMLPNVDVSMQRKRYKVRGQRLHGTIKNGHYALL